MIIGVKQRFSLFIRTYAERGSQNQSVTMGEALTFQASYFLQLQADRKLRLHINASNKEPLEVCIIAFEEKGNPATNIGEKSYFFRTSDLKFSYLISTLKMQAWYIAFLQLTTDFFYFLTVLHNNGTKELSKVRSQPKLQNTDILSWWYTHTELIFHPMEFYGFHRMQN